MPLPPSPSSMTRLYWRTGIALGLMASVPRKMRGRQRIARLLLGKYLDTQDALVHDDEGNAFLMPCLREPLAFHCLVDGIYEPDSVEVLRRALRGGGAFVDVGANVGLFSIRVARWAPERRVLAVEASPAIYRYLTGNIERNRAANVTPLCCAAGEQAALCAFYEAPAHHFGMGAMAAQFGVEPVQVPVQPLDALLRQASARRIGALKVDVEGFESQVFLGGREILGGRDAPVVVFEFCDWAEERARLRPGSAQEILMAQGFRIWRVPDYLRGGAALDSPMTSGSANLVAIRADDPRCPVQ